MIIEGILTIGQSNAGFLNGEPGGPALPTLDTEGQLMQLLGKTGGSICGEEPDTFIPKLERYMEPQGAGQTPAGMLGYSSILLDRYYAFPKQKFAIHTVFRGDTSLDYFFPGGKFYIYENSFNSQIAISTACAETGHTYRLAWIDIIQGEGGPFENYAETFNQYILKVISNLRIFSSPEKPIRIIYSQINSFTHATSRNPVAIEQWESWTNFKLKGAFLAGPMYQYPFHDPGHLTDIARMMHGEVRALVRHQINTTGDWTPLSPVVETVELRGASLRIEMALPPGTEKLSLDRDWVPSTPNEGFLVTSACGLALEIADVEIEGRSVRITLAHPIAEQYCIVEYATFNNPGVEWWASGRGHIYADSGVPSPFRKLGFGIPETIRHYCVSFSLTVPTRSGEVP